MYYPVSTYNGGRLDRYSRKFYTDQVHYKLSTLRLRQQRVNRVVNEIEQTKDAVPWLRPQYSTPFIDKDNYLAGKHSG